MYVHSTYQINLNVNLIKNPTIQDFLKKKKIVDQLKPSRGTPSGPQITIWEHLIYTIGK